MGQRKTDLANIIRFQELLEKSPEQPQRQTIEQLLREEREKLERLEGERATRGPSHKADRPTHSDVEGTPLRSDGSIPELHGPSLDQSHRRAHTELVGELGGDENVAERVDRIEDDGSIGHRIYRRIKGFFLRLMNGDPNKSS